MNEAKETPSTKSEKFRLGAATERVDCDQRKECTITNTNRGKPNNSTMGTATGAWP